MERRKILLGSGAVLATVLAGCSGADGDEEDDDHDDSRDDDGGSQDDDRDDYDDIPGFTPPEDGVDEYDGSIDSITRDGRDVHVEITTSKRPEEELYDELGQLSAIVSESVHDSEKFKAAVDTVYGTLYDEDGYELLTFYVEVEWAVDFANGELSSEAFADKILETIE